MAGRGDLWLSEALGARLIIPSYGSATIAITGTRPTGKPGVGSGLVLDERHILTARHVVDDMAVNEVLIGPSMAPPRRVSRPPATVRVVDCRRSEDIDLAVIMVEPTAEIGLQPLGGVEFRDPAWGDSTYVLGYPPSQLPDSEDGPNLIVQRGEVVNPAVRHYDRRPRFLYSAIARPGASGGPIVAQDGRVIGMVVADGLSARNTCGDKLSEEESAEFGSFYLGIPGRDILSELDNFNLGHLAQADS